MVENKKIIIMIITLVCLLITLSACGNKEVNEDVRETKDLVELPNVELTDEEVLFLENLRASGGLRVALREIESVYIQTEDGISGYNYKLLKSFGNYFNLKLELKFVGFSDYFAKDGVVPETVMTDDSIVYTPDLFDEVDLFCDVITVLPWREKLMSFIEVLPVKQLLIHRSGEYFEDITLLTDKIIAVKPDTSYETLLISKMVEMDQVYQLYYVDTTIEQLNAVLDKRADITLKDSNLAVLELQNYQGLELGIPISEIQMQGWAVEKDNVLLKTIIDKYLKYSYEIGERNKYWIEDYSITLSDYLKLIDIE